MKGTQMWIKRQEWDAQEKHPLRKGELKSQFLTLRVRRACVRACVSEHWQSVSGCKAAQLRVKIYGSGMRAWKRLRSGRLERSHV